jgi:glyoxylate reductase
MDVLNGFCEISMWEEEDIAVPRVVLEQEMAKAKGILCLLTETIDESLLENASSLKVISNMAVGYNNIDVKAATARRIMVTNTPGVLTETTADLTFALLMATARRLIEAAEFLRANRWKTWSPMMLTGQDVHSSTLGIIGFGSIGQAVARRAKGFNMNVLYYNRSRKPEAEAKLGAMCTDLETLLKVSDFVCILTPYNPETKNLIGKEQLALMKNTAVLINSARGGIVNEEALYQALKNREIWAAGLDVFEDEPVPLSHPLLELPNVVTLPHIGSASVNTRTRMAFLAAENLIKALSGVRPSHLVNPELLSEHERS